MDYKRGEKVIITDKLKKTTDLDVVPAMDKYCNCEAEIVSLFNRNNLTYYKLDIDDQRFTWDKFMFKGNELKPKILQVKD